ncbi:hypothetical protein CW304_23855 [Bacillus sp. UFRGS-B20]|nr:hypothetical protein CW304_23855 [Bacillus sp. UFRGS-B20]
MENRLADFGPFSTLFNHGYLGARAIQTPLSSRPMEKGIVMKERIQQVQRFYLTIFTAPNEERQTSH